MKSVILNIKDKEKELAKTLAMIKEHQEECHSFVTILDSAKLKSETSSLLSNVCYALKDNYSTKGILTTASSNTLRDYVPPFNSTVYEKLESAHAICIGKTVLDEFGMGGTGTTGHTGVVRNPLDKERIAGGSSAGSAAAVASHLVSFAIGSDTGDSVRKPAAYTGIVGYKPTYGMISRWGLLPFASSLDHVGIFSRSVLDAAIVADVLKGKDEKDMTTWDSSNIHLQESVEKGLNKKIKLCYIKEIVDASEFENVKENHQKVIDNFKKLLDLCGKENIEIDCVSVDKNLLAKIPSVYTCISCAEATSNMSNLTGIAFGPREPGEKIEDLMMNFRTKNFSPLIKRRFVIGSYVLQSQNQEKYFVNAQRVRRLLVDELKKLFASYDGLILPCSSSIAPKIEEAKDMMKKSDDLAILENHMALGNFGGFPSITIPCGKIENMPIGVNITSNIYEDEKLLSIASKLESMIDYEKEGV